MARHFSQDKINEYKECFFFHARKGSIFHVDELSLVMRSLGFSPTKNEAVGYIKKFCQGNNQIDFASFLDILHEHTLVENCQREILSAFRAHDVLKRGSVSAAELTNILTNMGEKLSRKEVDALLHEFNLPPNGQVVYGAFVKQLDAPIPDY